MICTGHLFKNIHFFDIFAPSSLLFAKHRLFLPKIYRMLQNWLSPSSIHNTDLDKQCFQESIQDYHDNPDALASAKIALIGINAEKADFIRTQLFDLAAFQVDVIDLGNLKNEKPGFAIQIIGILLKSNILPILFGGSQEFIFSLYHAFQLNEKMVNLTVIDNQIRFTARNSDSNAYLNPLLNPPHQNLFHLSIIGTQTHLNNPNLYNILSSNDFEWFSLGNIKSNPTNCEPLIRDADLLSFNLAAIKAADCPGQDDPFPTGLTAQEACTLARFAGLSDKLTAFGLFGYNPTGDQNHISAKMAALVIWYFLDGFVNRQNEFPLTKKGLKKYIVVHKKNDVHISFWKSIKTGRWWMEIPIYRKNQPLRHALLPCSYDDYILATKDQLPGRLLNGLSRIG